MSVIKAKGQQAKESASKANLDLSKVLLSRSKNFTSHKVRLLGIYDYVEFLASGAYSLSIYTQPVTEDSPLLVAYEHGGEKFKELKPKSRFLFAFASLETGEIVAIETSKNQAKTLIGNIEEYANHINKIGFNLKKTGADTNTTYTLNPIIAMSDEEQKAFDKAGDLKIEDGFYEAVLQPKSPEFLAKLLKDAGFDTDTYLPHIKIVEDAGTEPTVQAEKITKDSADEDLLSNI